ncbi:MAG: PAS domain-containing protein [Alphaproteobacteria bacterium]|nr:PAS domain-containing protein [Alphaproteobacteria bacterium]
MQRFLVQQNLLRFQRRLTIEPLEAMRATLRGLIAAAKRDLAILDAAQTGAMPGPQIHAEAVRRSLFQREFETQASPSMLLDARAGLRVVDVNDAYARHTLAARDKVAGEKLFDVFPDNPDDPEADGVSNLYASIHTAARTRETHVMATQRYDVRDASGRFVEKHWAPRNVPVFDAGGRLIYILHQAEDVTAEVVAARAAAGSGAKALAGGPIGA